MLSAIPDLSAQEKTNSSALCKRDCNNNKTTVVVAISNYSIYIALFQEFTDIDSERFGGFFSAYYPLKIQKFLYI